MSNFEPDNTLPSCAALDLQRQAPSARAAAERMLAAQFHIDSLFVPVPKLARALGLSPSTIYGYIRDGKFFLPYRNFNKSPMVKFADLVDWYCSERSSDVEAMEIPASSDDQVFKTGERADSGASVGRRNLIALGIDPDRRRAKGRRA